MNEKSFYWKARRAAQAAFRSGRFNTLDFAVACSSFEVGAVEPPPPEARKSKKALEKHILRHNSGVRRG